MDIDQNPNEANCKDILQCVRKQCLLFYGSIPSAATSHQLLACKEDDSIDR